MSTIWMNEHIHTNTVINNLNKFDLQYHEKIALQYHKKIYYLYITCVLNK